MKKYVKSLFTPEAMVQLVKVGLVGVVNTIVSFTLFNVFLIVLGGTKTVDEGSEHGGGCGGSFLLPSSAPC